MKLGTRLTRWLLPCAAAALLASALSGCAGGSRTELVVIPDAGEPPASATGGQPFRVKTIYRLPVSESDVVRPLGWSDPDTVIALTANLMQRDKLVYHVLSLAPPYTNSAVLFDADAGMRLESLSPDGRYLSGTSRTEHGIAVRLVSLPDGELRTVAELLAGEARLISEAGAWSANGRYLAYLLVGSNTQQERLQPQADNGNRQPVDAREELQEAVRSVRVLLFDVRNASVAQYPLDGLDRMMTGMTVRPSDDGGALLIVSDIAVRMAERNGDGYEVKFSPPIGDDGIEAAADWVDDDRFIYLDESGTLFAYDRRIGETVILKDQLSRYRLSRDREAIAYFASGRDSVFAGKLQGNNILYEQPVYQGIVPAFMDWSLDGGRLLIEGRKRYAPSGQIARPAPTTSPSEQPPVAEPSAGDQQLIVVFE